MPAEGETLRTFAVPAEANGSRLDLFLVQQLQSVSRSRVQLLLEQGSVQVDGKPGKASLKLHGGESIVMQGDPEPPPLRAIAENIPLDIVYEDEDLAVVDKPAGMMVHAGSGLTEDARNRGTLVNALLHHMSMLSTSSGPLRPGIVHRLDKQTSGLIMVAKNDETHAKLSSMFSRRQMRKTYIALVQGAIERDSGTVNAAISRDQIRRTRMTASREGGRTAISHWKVLRRIDGPYGRFSLLSVRIETGRTHQIRVHLSSLGHPVVGDTLYGAPAEIAPLTHSPKPHNPKTDNPKRSSIMLSPRLLLPRNFLHAAELEFAHPRTGQKISLVSRLPSELEEFLAKLNASKV